MLDAVPQSVPCRRRAVLGHVVSPNAAGHAPGAQAVAEPLVVVVDEQVRLVLSPTGGFGWATEPNVTAEPATSEVLLGISASDEEEVRAAVEGSGRRRDRRRRAGAAALGDVGTFADPDGHLWAVTAAGGVLA